MDQMINVGKRLKELRREKGVTQLEIADYLHCAPNTISLYEKGKQGLDLYAIHKLCQYYDVNSDYLLCLSDIRLPLNFAEDNINKIILYKLSYLRLNQLQDLLDNDKSILYKLIGDEKT